MAILSGTPDDDRLRSRGSDTLDLISGAAGDDTLSGGAGFDILIGGPGTDLLRGGEGGDGFLWAPGDGRDAFRGGAGNDTIGVDGAFSSVIAFTGLPAQFSAHGASIEVLEASGPFTGVVGPKGFWIEGSDRAEDWDLQGLAITWSYGDTAFAAALPILAGGGDDRVIGPDGGAHIFGGEGDDTLRDGAGADLLDGGAGNDRLRARDDGFADALFGGEGDDLLVGDADDAVLLGGDGNDTLRGNLAAGEAGDDLLDARGWAFGLLSGGEGEDRFLFALSSTGGYAITDFCLGDGGAAVAERLRVDVADPALVQLDVLIEGDDATLILAQGVVGGGFAGFLEIGLQGVVPRLALLAPGLDAEAALRAQLVLV